jgi:hypothetical protein
MRRRSAGSWRASPIGPGCEPAPSTGPTGFELARLLHSLHVRCEVIAPSLIPRAPGDQARDRPAGLPPAGPAAPRAGELVAVRIPSPAEEAVRDLCRTRADMVCDLTRARNRLGKFQLGPWAALAGRVDPNPRRPGVAGPPSGSTSPR